jgi:hypothetical protein
MGVQYSDWLWADGAGLIDDYFENQAKSSQDQKETATGK